MQLEEVLEEKYPRMNIHFDEYLDLQVQALERANDLGWEVVVIDFADPTNVYSDIGKVRELTHSLRGKPAIIFHNNPTKATDIRHLTVARGHTNCRDVLEGRQLFVTSYEPSETGGLSEPLKASPYWNVWGPQQAKTRAEINYLRGRLDLIRDLAGQMIDGERDLNALNIVGDCRAGKTTLLQRLTNLLGDRRKIGEYTTMEHYRVLLDDDQLKAIKEDVPGDVLVLDEAGLTTPEFRRQLQEHYKVVIYASLTKLTQFEGARVHIDYKATLQTP